MRANLRRNEEALDHSRVEIAVLIEKVKLLQEGTFSLTEKMDSLNRDKRLLQIKLLSVTKEKEELGAKLNSIKELKKIIRQLGIEAREKRIRRSKEMDDIELLKGNRGYLIVNGKSTMRPRIEIKVLPADLPR